MDAVSDTTRMPLALAGFLFKSKESRIATPLTENHVQVYPGRFLKSSESSLAGSEPT